LKILHLINGFGAGGAERSLVELLPAYRAAGIECSVAHLKSWTVGFGEEVNGLEIPISHLNGKSVLSWTLALRRLLHEDRPDLIHTSLFEADLVGRLAAVGTGIPVLTSLVNTSYDPARENDPHINQFGFRVVRAVDGITARLLTTHFHALTQAVKDAYINTLRLRPDRITVVPRGRERARLGYRNDARRLSVRQHLDIDSNRPVLLNVGRQEYQKGQIHLLDAMPHVLKEEPRVLLLVAGRPGVQTSALQERVRDLRLGDTVRFLGHRADVTDLMAAADVFVFPSLFEGLGGSVIEAMALGLPIVASDIPVLREVIGNEAGIFAMAGDGQALGHAITDILRNPAKAGILGEAGRRRFDDEYDLRSTARQMINMYQQVTEIGIPGSSRNGVVGVNSRRGYGS
jgi:glycosyltransferase involved in cell wall biosynthesis